MKKAIYIVCTTLLFAGCVNGQTQSGSIDKTKLTAQEFAAKLKENPQAQIVDVRTPQEFEKGYVENALNIDWNGESFEEHLSNLDPSKPVYVYCLSGGRSSSAANFMRKNGFEKVYEMEGGMMDWRAENLPETKRVFATEGLSTADYTKLVNSDKLVLVDFYADWCAPCKKMKPYLEKIAVEMSDKIILVRIDVDENPELCKELSVKSLPVLKLYKAEKIVWEHNGFVDEETVRTQLSK